MLHEYIFEPDHINEVLQSYDSIREKMGDARQEGKPAKGFPKARKTGREIYRILCSQHYPRLKELLEDLEFCIRKGWDQPKLLKTRSEKEFDSTVAELLVATHFAKFGLTVSSFDQRKGQERVPDVLANGNGFSCSCEVYAPRDWDGLEYFLEDLRLEVLHLDRPWDFHFEINMHIISHFDDGGRLMYFNPWRFSDAYESPSSRTEVIGPWISDICSELDRSAPTEITKRFNDESQNVYTEVSINRIQRSEEPTPIRSGICSPPTLTGYAPEIMFDRLVQRRILAKIRKKQSSGLGDFSALFVDISWLGYLTEFEHPFYKGKFMESVIHHLDPDQIEIDLVVFFCSDRSRDTGIKFPIVFKKTKFSSDNVECVLGGKPGMEEISERVLVEKG